MIAFSYLKLQEIAGQARNEGMGLNEVGDAVELVLDVGEGGNFFLGFFEIEAAGVVGVELLYSGALDIALLEILIVIQVTVVSRNSIEVTHVNGLGGFFLGEEGFVHLLSVADADYSNLWRFRVKPGMRGV